MVFRVVRPLPTELVAKVTAAQSKADAAMSVANTARSTANSTSQVVATLNPQVAAATEALTTTVPNTLAQAAAEHATIRAEIAAEKSARQAADTALQALVDALTARPNVTYRRKAVSQSLTLALGASTDVTVTWDTPMPDATYACWPVMTGAAGLAAIDPPTVKSQTAAGCVVTIRSRLALTATVTFTVYGLRVA